MSRKHALCWRKLLLRTTVGAAALIALVQVVPYGRAHSNPTVVSEPAWNSSGTRELAVRACFDCHSNETVWPWYSNIAPVSWLIQHDVEDGRATLDFSDWSRAQEAALEAARTVQEGEMPPLRYTLIHPKARLSAREKTLLAQGLQQTVDRSLPSG